MTNPHNLDNEDFRDSLRRQPPAPRPEAQPTNRHPQRPADPETPPRPVSSSGRGATSAAVSATTHEAQSRTEQRLQERHEGAYGSSSGGAFAKSITPTSGSAAALAFFGMLGAMALIFVFYFAAAALGVSADTAQHVISNYGTTFSTALLGVVLFFIFRSRGWTWKDAGFVRLPKKAWNLVWQVPVASAVTTAMVVPLASYFGLENQNDDNMAELLSDASLTSLGVSIIGTAFVAPVVEEFVFRRVLVGWLSKWMKPVAAVFVVALGFGMLHLTPYAIVWVTMLGVWSGLATLHYRSLWAGVIMHVANNLVSVSALIAAFFTMATGSSV